MRIGVVGAFLLVATQAYAQSSTVLIDRSIQTNLGFINVMAAPYNAKCNSGTDDYAALQAAINASIASGWPLYIPPNAGLTCVHTKPLVANGATLHIFGSSPINGFGSTLRGNSYTGPDLLIHNTPTPGFDTGAPLVGAVGASFKYNGNFSGTANLRQTPTIELNGLTDLTVEGWMKFTTAPATAQAYLVSSAGGLTNNAGDVLPQIGPTSAVMIGVIGGNAYCSLRISGVTHTLTTPAPSANAAHYYSCNWSSSTGLMDFFLDGARVSRAAGIAGTLTQHPIEDLHLGCTSQGSTMKACTGTDAGTLIDSVRISNSNRYGDASTIAVPSAKFTSDANTVALVNFDTDVLGFVKVYSGLNLSGYPSPYYVAFFGNGESLVGGADIHDLAFNGGLWCNFCVFQSKFRNLLFQYDFTGLMLAGNSNQDFIEGVSIVKGGARRRYGLAMDTGNGSRVDKLSIDAADFPLVINAGSPFIRDTLITPQSTTVYSLLSYQSRPLIDGVYFDDEGSTTASFVASMVFAQNWGNVSVNFAEIDSISGGGGFGKGIIFDGGYAGIVQNVAVTNYGSSNPASPLIYMNGNGAGMLSQPTLGMTSGAATPLMANRSGPL